MQNRERLETALDTQRRSYRLLRWMADRVRQGVVEPRAAAVHAGTGEAAEDWIARHLANLPADARPRAGELPRFARFFSTYLLTSFRLVPRPGVRVDSPCGCWCPFCTTVRQAPHLQPAPCGKRERKRAAVLMADRLGELAAEEGLTDNAAAGWEAAPALLADDDARRDAALSAYGLWLTRRLNGVSDGASLLALWREFAWEKGKPRPKFEVTAGDVLDAERRLIARAS